MKKTVSVTVKLPLRTLQVHDNDGDFRVSVPGESKVTFGPAIPASRTQRAMMTGGSNVYALRVYKGPTERAGLLAVFPGVTGFRDLGEVQVHRPARKDSGEWGWVEDNEWRVAKDVREKLNPTPDDLIDASMTYVAPASRTLAKHLKRP